MSVESYRLAQLKYAIFSRTGRTTKKLPRSKLFLRTVFNPIQARGGTLCPPHLYHSISSKRLGVWSYCFVTFLSMRFPFRKVQFHQSAFISVAMATMQLFGLLLKTQISNIFQVFLPERNVRWDKLLCFGHPNTLKSLIKANIRTVTMVTLQKIILPKYDHRD